MKIAFDTEAYKTQAIAGPFPSQAALQAACSRSLPYDGLYRSWAFKHGVNPQSGSIITSAYNPDLLDRRFNTLSAQLDDFNGAKQGNSPTSGLTYRIPPNLRKAVSDAAQEQASGTLKLLMISTTRENLHFDLREIMPNTVKLQTVVEAPTHEYADRCNKLIQTKAPELATELAFKSAWQNDYFHVAAINPAINYYDDAGIEKLVTDIRDAGEPHIIISNAMPNDDPDGAPQWMTQRYGGGVIAFCKRSNRDLDILLQNAGYTPTDKNQGPIDFDTNKGSSISAQVPTTVNLAYKFG